MTEQTKNEEEHIEETTLDKQETHISEEDKTKHTIPQIPGKTSKVPSFPNNNSFGKGSNFFNNSFNKQRQGRAAGRGR